jgi:hypothetical protein
MLLNDVPVIQDTNTGVSCFPWETEAGALHSYNLNNASAMTDSTLGMVAKEDTMTEANVVKEDEESVQQDDGQGESESDLETKAAEGMNFGMDFKKLGVMALVGIGAYSVVSLILNRY